MLVKKILIQEEFEGKFAKEESKKEKEGKGCHDHNFTTIQVKDVLFRQEVKGKFEKEDGKE